MALNAALQEDGALKNFRDFLETYNKISENCFNGCILSFNERNLTPEETNCTDVCVSRSMNLNQRLLKSFMVEQPKITEQKVANAQREAEEALKKLEAQGIDPSKMTQDEINKAMMENMASKTSQQ